MCRLREPSAHKNTGEDRRTWRTELAVIRVAIRCILGSRRGSASTCSGNWSEKGSERLPTLSKFRALHASGRTRSRPVAPCLFRKRLSYPSTPSHILGLTECSNHGTKVYGRGEAASGFCACYCTRNLTCSSRERRAISPEGVQRDHVPTPEAHRCVPCLPHGLGYPAVSVLRPSDQLPFQCIPGWVRSSGRLRESPCAESIACAASAAAPSTDGSSSTLRRIRGCTGGTG